MYIYTLYTSLLLNCGAQKIFQFCVGLWHECAHVCEDVFSILCVFRTYMFGMLGMRVRSITQYMNATREQFVVGSVFIFSVYLSFFLPSCGCGFLRVMVWFSGSLCQLYISFTAFYLLLLFLLFFATCRYRPRRRLRGPLVGKPGRTA